MRSNEERNLKTDLALDLNELQKSSGEELEALARDLDVYLHPARSRNQHIVDILRAALASGATVIAEGFPRPGGRFVRHVALAEIELSTCP